MAVIGNLAVSVTANTIGLTKGLGGAARTVSGFGKRVGGLVARIGPLAAGMAGLAGVGSAVAGVFSGIRDAADLEQAEIAFTTLLGGAENAKTVLRDLSDFAASTPFQLPQLTDAARQLAAFGFSTQEIVPSLRRLGDIAAGIGQPVEEIAEIFGKIRVQGRVMGEDINQLLGRGIPILDELARQFGVTAAEVKDMVSAGKIGFPEIRSAIESMTDEGGKFAGLMQAQSGSLTGLFSTLKDNVSFVFRDIGQTLIDAFDFKGAIAQTTSFVQSVRNGLASVTPLLVQSINVGKAAFSSLWNAGKSVVGGIFSAAAQTFRDMKDFMLDALIIGEFAFGNLGEIAALAWVKAKLGTVGFWEDFKFLFTDQIPSVLTWFADNWQDIFFTATDYALTALINLGQNIRALWSGVLDFIEGKGFNVDWTPLTEGAVSTLRRLPEIPERELTGLEQELGLQVDRMAGDLTGLLAEHMQMRRAELLGPGDAFEVADSGLGDLADDFGDAIADGASKSTGGIDFGLSAAQKQAIQLQALGASGGRKPEEQTARNTERMLTELQEQNRTMRELLSEQRRTPPIQTRTI